MTPRTRTDALQALDELTRLAAENANTGSGISNGNPQALRKRVLAGGGPLADEQAAADAAPVEPLVATYIALPGDVAGVARARGGDDARVEAEAIAEAVEAEAAASAAEADVSESETRAGRRRR